RTDLVTARRKSTSPGSPRRRADDAVAVGRPVLELRDDDRESIADALAELLVDCLADRLVERLDRERDQHAAWDAAENAAPVFPSSRMRSRRSRLAEPAACKSA